MFTIQSIMLMLLGFMIALLMGFVAAPAYWGRAVRLTSERLRRSLPVTEAEVRADKDRLRAQHAIRVHQLENRIQVAQKSAARQKVEINRRDAAITNLENEATRLNSGLDASENARRVLEQTIMDRVPRVEERLSEARKLLFQRDREMASLQNDTSKTYRALDEAMQINAQQRSEIDRLKSSLATRRSRGSKGNADPELDGDIALRSELEALRTRTRDQASLITKLQELVAANSSKLQGKANEQAERSKQLEEQVAELDTGLDQVQSIRQSVAENDAEAVAETAETIRELRAANEVQATEVEKLRAALNVYEEPEQDSRMLRDSKIALKARVASLEKETGGQADTIKRLRSELAGANDRSARQAAQHLNELRRLGAGTVPAAIAAKRQDPTTGRRPSGRRNLADRITETVPAASADIARAPNFVSATSANTDDVAVEAVTADESTLASADPEPSDKAATLAENGSGQPPTDEATDAQRKKTDAKEPEVAAAEEDKKPAIAAQEATPGAGRGSLMQRIAGLTKG
ncbi:MAG: hypothetical protein ACR2OV_14510 [Hyphomicrobiaceae bacterium]